MAFLSGKNGFLEVDGNLWRLRSWTADFQTDILDTSNFESVGGKRENLDGLGQANITLRGQYDVTAMGATSGGTYDLVLGAGVGVGWAVQIRIENIRLITDVEKVVEVEITGKSNGDFLPAIA